MRLVLDTNILIAALIRNAVTREIITHPELECLMPEFAFQEIKKHQAFILQKSRLSVSAFDLLLDELQSHLTVVPESEIVHREEASRIMDHIDPEDTLFVALALSTHNDGIWSEDKHFEKQTRVRVWKTKELIEYFGTQPN